MYVLKRREKKVATITGKKIIHDFELHLSHKSSQAIKETTAIITKIIAKTIAEITFVTFYNMVRININNKKRI